MKLLEGFPFESITLPNPEPLGDGDRGGGSPG
jgi:hypothetical protein